jgi:CheY-like chemotaxis protein
VERGTRNPSVESIEKVANALEISVSMLFEQAGNGSQGTQFVEILLVEDNAQDVQLTIRAFARAKISNPLHVVTDGAEALDFIFAVGRHANRAGMERPQIILLDLNLPTKSGIEVLREIKANKRTQRIPVIVLTASGRDRDISECRRLGAETYIVKPVGFENFSEVTRQFRFGWALIKPGRAVEPNNIVAKH